MIHQWKTHNPTGTDCKNHRGTTANVWAQLNNIHTDPTGRLRRQSEQKRGIKESDAVYMSSGFTLTVQSSCWSSQCSSPGRRRKKLLTTAWKLASGSQTASFLGDVSPFRPLNIISEISWHITWYCAVVLNCLNPKMHLRAVQKQCNAKC